MNETIFTIEELKLLQVAMERESGEHLATMRNYFQNGGEESGTVYRELREKRILINRIRDKMTRILRDGHPCI